MSLAEVEAAAALLDREDRKYVVSLAVAEDLIGSLSASWRVLEIDGTREFAYRTVYLDDAELRLFHAAARRRRRRFKVRTRRYEHAGETFIEIKQRLGRGRSVKSRLRQLDGGVAELDEFVTEVVGDQHVARDLRPTLTSSYRRITLVDPDAPARLTLDAGLVCTDVTGDSVTIGGLIVVETKSGLGRTAADRWLWRCGHRPVRFSKYATALVALRPELPHHPWNRTRKFFRAV